MDKLLTVQQRDRIPEWAARWDAIMRRTGPADRPRFETAAARCYRLAGLPWHGNVVWASSPLVLALAAPVAALTIEIQKSTRRIFGAEKVVLGALDELLARASPLFPASVSRQVFANVITATQQAIRGAMCEQEMQQPDSLASPAINPNLDEWIKTEVHESGSSRNRENRKLAQRELHDCVERATARDTFLILRQAVREAAVSTLADSWRTLEFQVAFESALSEASDTEVDDLGSWPLFSQEEAIELIVQGISRHSPSLQGVLDKTISPKKFGLLSSSTASLNTFEGQFDHWTAPLHGFLREICQLDAPDNLWERSKVFEETIHSAGAWLPHREFLMVCERPQAIALENVTGRSGPSRLHRSDGPAITWPDGWGAYAMHGIHIPYAKWHIVEAPERITVAEIEGERNAEIRRVMMERYGMEKFVRSSDATVTDEFPDDYPITGLRSARLLRKEVANDESIIYVDLLNSTPEPDGTIKRYMLRVDPWAYAGEAARNAHAAAASTWRNADGSLVYEDWRDYRPALES